MSPKKWNAIYTTETLPVSATYRTAIYTVSQGNNISPALFPLLRDRKKPVHPHLTSKKRFFSQQRLVPATGFILLSNKRHYYLFFNGSASRWPCKNRRRVDRSRGEVLTFGTLNRRVWGGGRRRGRADLCANCALNAALYSVASR